jgi:hypothetical protein
MTGRTARATLRREVSMCAAAVRSEREFFAGLDAAGLLVRLHYSADRPSEVSGYAVSLPGMTYHRDGQQVWYGGQTLDGQLSLAALRRSWQAGRPGTRPAPQAFAAADTGDIFGYAAAVADAAARQLRTSPPPGEAADIAWAAADVLTAAAEAVGSPELQRAADGFRRAARAPWGRIPPSSPGGATLRTAAYLLAACTPDRSHRTVARLTLISALAGLARAVAKVRESEHLLLQAAKAHRAAAGLAAAAANNDPAVPARLAAADFAGPPVTVRPAAARAGRARGPATRPGPSTGPRPIR